MRLIAFLTLALQICGGAHCGHEQCHKDRQETNSPESFGLDIFRVISDEGRSGNIFISPASLSTALALAAEGAVGTTKDCILSPMGLDASSSNVFFKALSEGIATADSSCALKVANSIWIHNGLDVKEKFLKEAAGGFNASIATRDFDNLGTVNEINGWCSDKTDGLIDSILDRLDSGTPMALLNALYFKGTWNFSWSKARNGHFACIDGSVKDVPLMHAAGHFEYSEDEFFQMARFPYGNGNFAMEVLLPKENVCFEDAVKNLDFHRWKALEGSADFSNLSVTFPKFKIESDAELSEILKKMGMGEAFSGKADFSGMSGTPLAIGMVRQKTFVDVNEYGTEAAAVTVIAMKNMAMPVPVERIVFKADRPFIFAIRERSTGSLLFIGQKVL